MNSNKKIIAIAHSGLERTITESECRDALKESDIDNILLIDFRISNSKLSEGYNLAFEQMALEQMRKFKIEIEPIIKENPNATIAYFGLVPIPLAFHLGVLLNNFQELLIYQFHHERKIWYRDTPPIKGFKFELDEYVSMSKVEKGKGDISIRISTSYRIEPQHTYDSISNPTNEFDINLKAYNIDSVSTAQELDSVVRQFQNVLSDCTNFLPDRDKIHLFIASSSGVSFALGTRINPNIYPSIQTYQYSKDETPKYTDAISITKSVEELVSYSEAERLLAKETRAKWNTELTDKIIPFINRNSFDGWFNHIIQNDEALKNCLFGSWVDLPDLKKTSLIHDSIDLTIDTVDNGFKYDNANSKWYIDDGMLMALSRRFTKNSNIDINRAGRLFLFHEALHYSNDGHRLIGIVANGIGRFPKVIEEADYQADVWALLYEYRFSFENTPSAVNNLKKFFLDTIETAIETMWSFNDNGHELTEIQIRSMNRFLNWYWQWVRIERLQGNGTLTEIIKILFEKPVIEFAGADIITDKLRTYFKLSSKPVNNYELAIFFKNTIHRSSPIGITSIVEGFRELNGEKIKEGLRSFFANLN